MARVALVFLLLASGGCEKQLHGTARVFLYNGTDARAVVKMEGRSPIERAMRSHSGELIEDVIAGAYNVVVNQRGQFPQMIGLEVVKDTLSIINVGGTACFARADVSGMYNQRKAPVRLLALHKMDPVITIRDEVAILPGQPMPATRPKNAFTFQRVAAVPCDLAEDDWSVEDYLQKLR